MTDKPDPPEIERLAAQLRDGNKSVREAAGKALVQMGEPAIPYLVRALHIKVGGYYGRFQARDSLIAIGTPAKPALLEVVRSNPNTDWGAAALGVLAALRDETLMPLFVENLASNHPDTQTAATTGLVKLKDAAVPMLIQTLDDADWRVRNNAIRALGRLKVLSAVPRLLECLKDTSTMIDAAHALWQIGGESARAASAVLFQLARDSSGYTQLLAAELVSQDNWHRAENNPELLNLFLKLVQDRAGDMPLREIAFGYIAAHAPDDVKRQIFHAVVIERPHTDLITSVLSLLGSGDFYDASLIPRVIDIARAAPYKQRAEEALFEMARYHDPAEPVVPELVDWLSERSRQPKQISTRARAILGLGGLKSPAGIPALVDRLDDTAEYQLNVGADEQPEYEKVTLGELAERALRQIGTPEALNALETWRKSKG